MQTLGLTKEYNQNKEFQKFVRRIICLGLAPFQKIDDLWLEFQDDMPISDTIQQLIDYFVETWLEDHALFHRSIWNHSDNVYSRTNNDLEGWHNKLNRYVKKVSLR